MCCRSIYCVTARSSRPFAVDVVRDGPARAISCAVVHIISKSTKEKMESVYTFPIGHSYIVKTIDEAFYLFAAELLSFATLSLLCCVSRTDLYV